MKYLYILVMLFFSFGLNAQFLDDFSDGNLNANPRWEGDIDSFTINTEAQLQLNASTTGSSFIYTPYLAEDSLEWSFYIHMDFSPSSSNASTIYLNIDNNELTEASGYYLQVGESGSNDALRFYRQQNGNSTLLANASMGAMATDPSIAFVKMTYHPDGIWTLWADYLGSGVLEEEFQITENDIPISGNRFFGIACDYTSTRVDKFFFDDILVESFAGGNPPSLLEINVINIDSIVLHYNKILSTENNQQIARVSIDQGIGIPLSLIVNTNDPSLIEIKLQNELKDGIIYQLCSENISDNAGASSELECIEIFNVSRAEQADLFINEILFNPPVEAEDFVELINVSQKILSLESLFIANSQNQQRKIIDDKILIKPGEILAFTKDALALKEVYEPESPENIIEQALPAFNVDEGNVWIYYMENENIITIDSFDYSKDYHFELLDDLKGVSLEKIISDSNTNDKNSWHSAAENVGFASPGDQNSNNIKIPILEDIVSIKNKIFSPNGDARDDFLVIGFNLDNPGYIANIKIFNDRGYLIRHLSNNELIGPNGIVKWDGISNDGILSDLGIYIIAIELFDLSGDVMHIKKTCVLADFLD